MTEERAKAHAKLILAAVDNFIEGREPKSNRLVSFIDTRPFNGLGYKSKIANKIFHAPLFVIKKSLINYFVYRTSTDDYTKEGIDEVAVGIEDVKNKVDETKIDLQKLLDEKIYQIMKLNDMLKSELMAEFNKDISPLGEQSTIKTKWLKPDSKMYTKLNLGSGSHIFKDYINIDHRPISGVDLVCDIKELPFSPNSIDEIYASHVIEHFTERNVRELLGHWLGILKPGGIMKIIVPNISEMAKKYAKGEIEWDSFRKVILGGQDYNSDYHFNAFSEDYLVKLLKEINASNEISIAAKDRKNGEAYELEVQVIKRS